MASGATAVAVVVILGALAAGAADPASPAPHAQRSERGAAVMLRSVGEFDSPTFAASAPGFPELLFVVERGGRVMVLRNGEPAGTFLDIADRVSTGGERGLLSIAFAPDYERSRRFFVYYTDRSGDIQVDHFRRSSDSAVRAVPGSRRPIITVPHPGASNHNGGTAAFGPDGRLYLATGDGGASSDTAQDRRSLLGKLLRIDPRPSSKRGYQIPKGNPFRGRAGRNEIFALGLRNPFRFSFDRDRPMLAIGDVGEGSFEEVNYLRVKRARAANFGWDAFEGRARHPSATNLSRRRHSAPMHVYPTSGPNCAVTGGVTVRDRTLPDLVGRYLYADHCAGELRSFEPRPKANRARDDRPLGIDVRSPVAFGEDRAGGVYVVSLDGEVARLAPPG